MCRLGRRWPGSILVAKVITFKSNMMRVNIGQQTMFCIALQFISPFM
jgi:hypothetical protein